MKKIKGKYLLVLLAMCGLTASALGMLTNVSGLFFTPIAQDLGLGQGSVSATLTISNLVFAVGGIASAKIAGPKTFKPMLILGTGVFILGTVGLAGASHLTLLYLLNGLRGFAAGVVGNVLVTTVINNWFQTGAGLATSVAMGCSGMVGALLSPVLSAVIQGAGWRTGYLCAGAVIALFNLPAILFPITFRPEDAGLDPLGGRPAPLDIKAAAHTGKISGILLALALVYAAFGAYVTALPQHFPGIAGSYGLAAAVGSGMLSVCMIANTAGKLVFGILADRLGAKRSILLYSAFIAAGALLMLFVHAPGVMFLTAALFGLSYSLPTVGAVLVTKELFGMERYSQVYPKVNLSTTITNAVATSLIGFLYDAHGAYTLALLLVFGMMLLQIAVVLTAYRRKAGDGPAA